MHLGCCICFIAYLSNKVLVLSSILILFVSDPSWCWKIISFGSYLYVFSKLAWYHCSITMYKQICLEMRIPGEKPFSFRKKMAAADCCLLEMVGEGKMEVQVRCQRLLLFIHFTGLGGRWFSERLPLGSLQPNHIEMPLRWYSALTQFLGIFASGFLIWTTV